MTTTAIALLPARYASTRFPAKPLAKETGKFLIQHVYEQASLAKRISQVIVATDDARIEEAVKSFGGTVVMTSPDHPNGTSRLAEVAASLNDANDDTIFVNVQGDEPEIDPGCIDQVVDVLDHSGRASIGTLASPFADDEDPSDPNLVKVVCDRTGHALYFSRACVPFDRDNDTSGLPPIPLKHIGLYAYRKSFLAEYVQLPPTPLEQAEQLEQLRALEHGKSIAVGIAAFSTHPGIDTPNQYAAFVNRWRSKNH